MSHQIFFNTSRPGVWFADSGCARVARILPAFHRYRDHGFVLVGSRIAVLLLLLLLLLIPTSLAALVLTWRPRINYGMRTIGGSVEYQVPLALQAVPAV